MTCMAQTTIDHFNVGPYVVDYNGKGDIKYRLRDNINLYEFFDLKKDTAIISTVTEVPVKSAFQISGRLGTNRCASKEIGLEGLWKYNISTNLYFNSGLSLAMGHTNFGEHSLKRDMLEIGIPLQLELGGLSHQYASVYGIFGLSPTFYSTMKAEDWENEVVVDGEKKSGFLIAPVLEFGGNIPIGATIIRIGVYGTYKINCTTGNFDVYKQSAGRAFFGAKIGFVL